MARALVRGWGQPVLCTDLLPDRAQALADEVGGEAVATSARAGAARRLRPALPQARRAVGGRRATSAARRRPSSRSSARRRWRALKAGLSRHPGRPHAAQHPGRGRAAASAATRATPTADRDFEATRARALRPRRAGRDRRRVAHRRRDGAHELRARLLRARRRGADRRRRAPRPARRGRAASSSSGRWAGTAALLRAPRRGHARRAPRGHLPGRLDRARAGRAGARRTCGPRSRTPSTPCWTVDGDRPRHGPRRHRGLRERGDPRLHDHHLRLHPVQPRCSRSAAGSRTTAGRTRCWRSCATSASPTCGSSGSVIPQFGPFDFSPIVAIIVLQIVGGHHRRRHPRLMGNRAWARMVAVAIAVIALDQITKALVTGSIERGGSEDVVLGIRFVQRPQHRRRVQLAAGRRRRSSGSSSPSPSIGLLWYFSRHVGKPLVWLPTGHAAGRGAGQRRSTASARARSSTSSRSSTSGRRSTSPTSRSRSGVLLLLWVMERGECASASRLSRRASGSTRCSPGTSGRAPARSA